MKCADCPYYWQEEYDDFACCHYYGLDKEAPCELEDEEKRRQADEEEYRKMIADFSMEDDEYED